MEKLTPEERAVEVNLVRAKGWRGFRKVTLDENSPFGISLFGVLVRAK